MGLSASQARLLSITARLSDNELHSQMIANSKVRLADQTQEASREYIQALDASKLMLMSYDSKGNSTALSLTPALIYQFDDLKNQYGISNIQGQLLVSSTDAKNFEASSNILEFLELNGCELANNPKYEESLKKLYGENYDEYFDINTGTPKELFDGVNVPQVLESVPFAQISEVSDENIGEYINNIGQNITKNVYNQWANKLLSIDKQEDAGYYGVLIDELRNVPAYPGAAPVMPDFAALAEAYNSSACHDSVSGANKTGIWHMEHNLCHLIWGDNGLSTKATTGSNGNVTYEREILTSSAGTITITPKSGITNNSLTDGFAGSGVYAAKGLLNAFSKTSDYTCIQNLINDIKDLYCDVVNYLDNAKYWINEDAYSINSSEPVKTEAALMTRWEQIYTDLANLNNQPSNQNDLLKKQIEWKRNCEAVNSWTESVSRYYNEYLKMIDQIPLPQIIDENDGKNQWYVNLWHRMNGGSDTKSAEGISGKYYKLLEDNFLKSSSWLQFALENGVVSLEQVKYKENAETETGLKSTSWEGVIYSSCPDIQRVDDEVAIAKAEAEYTKKLNEIEAKDKQYDNDLKKLDTEHNALQTEYESIANVVNKNVERSFKAFS